MKPNANWTGFKDQIAEANLKPEIAAAMTRFLDTFQALPAEPSTFNPGYMGLLLMFMVDDVCSEDEVGTLMWEMTLDMAKKWAMDRGDDGSEAVEAIEILIPLLAAHFNNDDTDLFLKEIDGYTVYGVVNLYETLSEPQRFYVAPNANSLAEAHFTDRAWYRAIYAGRALVGFVMLSIDSEKPHYSVWRLMIGEPYQGRGYGRKAMEAIMEYVRTLPNATQLELSYGQGPGSPEGFYRKLGFEPTGKVEWGEVYARINL